MKTYYWKFYNKIFFLNKTLFTNTIYAFLGVGWFINSALRQKNKIKNIYIGMQTHAN